jgi:glycerol-3-phosphate dehydrogenase
MTDLGDGRFDALVVGGGVYGALLALEGASRGQRVLLAERGDFGAGATFNHLRTIHGGLRYLQFLDLRRAVISNRQRLWWLRTFPDLVHPVDCLMPLYGQGLRRPAVFGGALRLGRMLGMHLDGDGQPRRFEVIPTDEVVSLMPACRRQGLSHGALWQDAFMPRSHRLVVELLHWATSAGAVVRNRLEVLAGERRAEGWRVSLRDHRDDAILGISTRRIINTAGTGVGEVIRRLNGKGDRPRVVPTVAWGLLLDRPPLSACSVAVAPPGKGRRTYFVHPYHGKVLAGTGHAGMPADSPVPEALPESRVSETLADLNEALPGVRLEEEQVRHVFWGILPGIRPESEALLMRPEVVDHARRDGLAGVWSILGVKFTEAPFVARQVWDRITGSRSGALPARPPARNVPTIDQVRAMTDSQFRAVLRALAAEEWVVEEDDLVWRRTDLWMDPTQRRRAVALMA